jgi:hypothetical protein
MPPRHVLQLGRERRVEGDAGEDEPEDRRGVLNRDAAVDLVKAGEQESRGAHKDDDRRSGLAEDGAATSSRKQPAMQMKNTPRAVLVEPGGADIRTSPVASHAPANRPSAVPATVSRARKDSTEAMS